MCRVLVDTFGVVHVQRTSSNLLEPQHCRDTKVCRDFSPEVSVIRLYGTFSTYIFTEETRCAGCSYTSSGWFKRLEPPRTFSNHMTTEQAERVVVFPRRLGRFDCTEPSLATSLQGKQGVQGARARVQGGSRTSNLLELSRTTASQREQGV